MSKCFRDADRRSSAQMVLTHRSNPYTPMSPRTKKCIKWLRRIQLGLRLLELNGGIGILVLMILLTKVEPVVGWILRIAVRRIFDSIRRHMTENNDC